MCSNNKSSNSESGATTAVCPILHRLLALDTCHLVTNCGTKATATIKATNYASSNAATSIIKQKLLIKKQKQPFFFILRLQWLLDQPIGLSVLLALLAYANTLSGDFVHDDIPAIVNNPDVNGANTNVLEAFSNDFWGEPMASVKSHKSYRPLTILIFRLNHYLGGGQSWPFHGTNIILHGCATFLLGCICCGTLQLPKLTCLVAASLFALHPIHTEAVSGLVGCADLLACNLTLMSFLAYTRYLENPSKNVSWHWLSLCCASGAVLSKEIGIMSVAINIGYGLFRSAAAKNLAGLSKTFKRLFWADTLTLCMLLAIRMIVQNSSQPEFSAQDNPAAFHKNFLTRTLTFLYLPVHNFWLLLCPNALSYDWQMGSLPLIHSPWDFRALLALPLFYGSLLFGFTRLFFKQGEKMRQQTAPDERALAMAGLFLVLPFLPASNLFFPVGFVVAERILYLPSIGFCLLVALGLERLLAIIQNSQPPGIPASGCSSCSTTTGRRKRSSSQSSMSSTASSTKSGGRRTSKIRRPRRRLRKEPHQSTSMASAAASNNVYFLALFFILLGMFTLKTWSRNHDWNSRRGLFRSGLKTQPTNAKVHYNYANVLKEDGQSRLAVRHYREALRLWPSYVLAHNNLATLLEDRQEALHHLKMALNIDPWHPNSLYNLALLHREAGDCSRAIPLLEKCISVEPNHERAYPVLSDCLFSQNSLHQGKLTKMSLGTMSETEDQNEERMMIRKSKDDKLTNGADVTMGGEDAASTTTAESKNMASILSHLAEFYMGLEKWNKAEMALQRILSREPEHDVALYQLSQVYLEQNKTRLALEAIKSAAKNGCKNKVNLTQPSVLAATSTSCVWGTKCTTKAHLCTQIVIQEADILRAMRHYKLAAKRYTLALEMSPQRESELLLNLGSVHHAMGEWELAKRHYSQCLKLEPNNQVVIANMKLLGSQLYELKNH